MWPEREREAEEKNADIFYDRRNKKRNRPLNRIDFLAEKVK